MESMPMVNKVYLPILKKKESSCMKRIFNNKPIVLAQITPKVLFELDKDKVYTLTIEEKKTKRTLDQNSYYWSLLFQLASALKTSSNELHDTLIKRYTEPILIPLLKEVNPDGYFRYYDEYKNTLINDKEAIYYKVYKGSSEMNTIEFKGLLDGLISECRECNIEVMTEDEISRLKTN